jgi:hypothetical protein
MKPARPHTKLRTASRLGTTGKGSHLVLDGTYVVTIVLLLLICFRFNRDQSDTVGTIIISCLGIVAFGMAVVGICQQYELLRRHNEHLVLAEAYLETSIPSTLTNLFEQCKETGFESTDEFEALLASPAFGILGGVNVFKSFVDLLEHWLMASGRTRRTLTLHILDVDAHTVLFGQTTGTYREQIYGNPSSPKKVTPLLLHLGRLVALLEWAHSSRTVDVRWYRYPKLTNFRMILAKNDVLHLSAVMAFEDEKGASRPTLDCLATFATHLRTYAKARSIMHKHCGDDSPAQEVQVGAKGELRGLMVKLFELTNSQRTQLDTHVETALRCFPNHGARTNHH